MSKLSIAQHLLGFIAVLMSAYATADTSVLSSVADNTLIEDVAGQGILNSDGQGTTFFAGTTQRAGLRRGLLRFNLTTIPSGAIVTSASLRLQLIRTRPESSPTVRIHRLTQSWDEGTSVSFGGIGSLATLGDATWLHRFCGAPNAADIVAGRPCGVATSQFWTTAGGDFVAGASAVQSVVGLGPYSWSSAQLTADVQSWINVPASNFGWVVVDEPSSSSKGYASRENVDPTIRPQLTITWSAPTISETNVPLPLWAAIALGAGLLGIMRRRDKRV